MDPIDAQPSASPGVNRIPPRICEKESATGSRQWLRRSWEIEHPRPFHSTWPGYLLDSLSACMAMVHGGPHRCGVEDHNGLLFEWLISLRFTPEDARGYATALVRLGFDDLQSVREVSSSFPNARPGLKLDRCRQTSRRCILVGL